MAYTYCGPGYFGNTYYANVLLPTGVNILSIATPTITQFPFFLLPRPQA